MLVARGIVLALACCVPVIVLFWQDHGLSLTHITILQSVFALLMTLLEVPSGYIADVYGRKRTLVLGSLGVAGGAGIYWFAGGYGWFLIAEVLFASGFAMVSGADSAWLYDLLKAERRENEYQRVWGTAQAISMAGYAVFAASGGMLYEVHRRAPFYASAIISLLGVLCAVALREGRLTGKTQHATIEGLARIVRPALAGNRAYREILGISALIFASFQIGLWYYQPYFVLGGIRPVWFGLLFASFNVVAALASKNTEKLDRLFEKLPSGTGPMAVISLGFVGMGLMRSVAGVPLILIHQVVRGWHMVSISHKVNRLVASEQRATLLSLVSLTNRGLYGLVVPLAGLAADTLSLPGALLLAGSVVGAGALSLCISAFVGKREQLGRKVVAEPE